MGSIQFALFPLLLFLFVVITSGLANSILSDRNFIPENEVSLQRVKRQEQIGEFKNVVCNRTVWKSTMQPYLEAEGLSQRDHENEHLITEYNNALAKLNQWKSQNLARLHDVCGLQKFLECKENSRCECGSGDVPYSFEPKDSNTCLAKRGSICLHDQGCVAGLKCQERYCGGAKAFLEESKLADEKNYGSRTLGGLNYSLISTILSIIIAFSFF